MKLSRALIGKRGTADAKPTGSTIVWLSVKNPIPEDLKIIRLPDESIYLVDVDFTSSGGRKYTIAHYTNTYGQPIIKLESGKEKDEKDFNGVYETIEGIVAREVGILKVQYAQYWMNSITRTIFLRKKLTLTGISALVEEYKRHFNRVTIQNLRFYKVPESAYENSGLPLERLVLGDV